MVRPALALSFAAGVLVSAVVGCGSPAATSPGAVEPCASGELEPSAPAPTRGVPPAASRWIARFEAADAAEALAQMEELRARFSLAPVEVDELCDDRLGDFRGEVQVGRVDGDLDGDGRAEALVWVTSIAPTRTMGRCERTFALVFGREGESPLSSLDRVVFHCTYDEEPAALHFVGETDGGIVQVAQRAGSCGTLVDYDFALSRVRLREGRLEVDPVETRPGACVDRLSGESCMDGGT